MHNVLLSTEQQKNITSLIATAKKKITAGEITLSNKTHFKIFEKHIRK